ncbi:MAG: hypothetical protein ACR2PM_12575 [Hyphomicrobiales bacterium]
MIAEALAVRSRARQSRQETLPAPIRGLNARDALENLKDGDAVRLDNLWPGFQEVELRGGYVEHATGIGSGDVETLATYEAGSVSKMLAAGDGEIADATGSGASTQLATGFSVNRWQTANFNGSMGWVNGTDAPQVYDGSTVGAMTVSGTGLTVANLIGINVFKSRTYFWEANSQDFWYSAVNALGGALTKFPLSRVGQFGGNLVTMVTWTRDGGDGLDDLAVFVMSSGETIVYQGSDPGDSANWSLVGVFRIGSPVDIRAALKVAGDVVIATADGYASLAKALPVGRTAPRAQVSDRIVKAVVDQVRLQGGNFGWQIAFYPRKNMLIGNHPSTSSGEFNQYVLNLATGAWARFKGIPARQFAVYDDDLYFAGAGGKTFKADTGFNDDGAAIDAEGLTAYSYLKSRGRQKMMQAVRPVVSSDGTLPLSIDVEADFGVAVKAKNPVDLFPADTGSAEWDVAEWDVDSWAGESLARDRWFDRGGLGYAFALRLRYSGSNRDFRWTAHSFLYELTAGF